MKAKFKREEKKADAKKADAKKPACKFVRVKNAPTECKSVKNKSGDLFFISPYTGNRNRNDMIKIHRNMGAHTDSMMHYVSESIGKKMKETELLKGLEKFVNPEAKTDNKPSILLSKSRYRLKHDGRPTIWNESLLAWEFARELTIPKTK